MIILKKNVAKPKDFSLHLLELVINSINASATQVVVVINTNPLRFEVIDNGCTISKTYNNELIENDHGLGQFSFFMKDQGSYSIVPLLNGTKVSAIFDRDVEIGDLNATMITTFCTVNPVAITYIIDGKKYNLKKDKSNLTQLIKELRDENS